MLAHEKKNKRGRPQIGPADHKSKLVKVRFKESEHQALKQQSEDSGLPLSEIIRKKVMGLKIASRSDARAVCECKNAARVLSEIWESFRIERRKLEAEGRQAYMSDSTEKAIIDGIVEMKKTVSIIANSFVDGRKRDEVSEINTIDPSRLIRIDKQDKSKLDNQINKAEGESRIDLGHLFGIVEKVI